MPPAPRPVARLRYPKSIRLRKRRDFVRVQDKSARVSTPHLVLLVASAPGDCAGKSCRLGVVASKKVGGAVQRNRVKRLVREVFRTHPALFPRSVDLVVIARPGAPDQSFATIFREIEASAPALSRAARQALSRSGSAPARPAGPRPAREVLRK